MAIKISIGNIAKFKVEGTTKNETGADVPFSFSLECDRITSDQLAERIEQAEGKFVEILAGVVRSWDDVKTDDGASVPYSVEALRELCLLPGLARVAFNAYVANVGAKAKN